MLQDLETFIRVIHPHRVLGDVHCELIDWWYRPDRKTNQIVLLPRDHQKSALIAYRVAWEITRNPAIRIIYVSATSKLAIKQLHFIKGILTSDKYRYYFPEMLHEDESRREKWKEDEICVDHIKRKQESVRDSTVFAVGLTTTVTGLHCDIVVFDDVVIDDNVASETLRNDVADRCGYFTSIAGTDSENWVVGTRYHPKDWYGLLLTQFYEVYDEDGNIVDKLPLYEIFERKVEDKGDGTGQFLWPREQRTDGKWFGFNREILSKKRAGYPDPSKFRAQYYNEPNDLSSATITPDDFQYYDRQYLRYSSGHWYFRSSRLNIAAAVDFAYSTSKAADHTSIIVVGVDAYKNYFVLDIVRFKTDKISEYYNQILKLHEKWSFRKIRMETTAAQKAIVKALVDDYIRPNGLVLSVDGERPVHNKSKEERIESILQSKYHNKQIWHYKGGLTPELEQELVLKKPPHDDMKDALASAVEYVIPPSVSMNSVNKGLNETPAYHPRFGGTQ